MTMNTLVKALLLGTSMFLLTACGGGGGGSSDEETATERTFSLQLQSADIRLSSNGEALDVETTEIEREQLSVR